MVTILVTQWKWRDHKLFSSLCVEKTLSVQILRPILAYSLIAADFYLALVSLNGILWPHLCGCCQANKFFIFTIILNVWSGVQQVVNISKMQLVCQSQPKVAIVIYSKSTTFQQFETAFYCQSKPLIAFDDVEYIAHNIKVSAIN